MGKGSKTKSEGEKSPPISPGRQKISDQIKNLLDIGKDILEQEAEITEIERIIEERDTLEEQLGEKTTQLKAKEMELETLKTSKETELAELKTSKEKEITELKVDKESQIEILKKGKSDDLAALQKDKDDEVARVESEKASAITALEADKAARIDALEKEKNGEIETIRTERTALQLAKDALFEEFQEKYREWHLGTLRQEQLEIQVSNLEAELSESNGRATSTEKSLRELQVESVKDKGELEVAERKLKSLTEELSKKKWELEGAVMQLSSSESSLQQEKRELELEEVEASALETKFNAFAKRCHEMAKKFFLTKLPESHDSTWEDIGKKLSQSNVVKVALKKTPMSDSVQSQYLRTAAVEKIISDKLCSKIFQQYYLPDSAAARREIDEVLKRLYAESHRGEAIFRLRLLAAYKSEEKSRVKLIIDGAVEEVVKLLEPLLFGTRDAFAIELERLFREAAELWRPVQRSSERGFVANVVSEPEPEQDWDWEFFEDYDNAVSIPPEEAVRIPDHPEALLCLFPQVFINNEVVCHGYALWSHQATVVLGGMEYTSLMPRSTLHARTGAFAGRTFLTRQRDRRVSSMGPSAFGRRQLMGDGGANGLLPGNLPVNSSFLVKARDRRLSLPGMLQPGVGGPLGQGGHEMGVPVGNSGA